MYLQQAASQMVYVCFSIAAWIMTGLTWLPTLMAPCPLSGFSLRIISLVTNLVPNSFREQGLIRELG